MNRSRKALLIAIPCVLCALFATILLVKFRHPREPFYNGHTFREWISCADPDDDNLLPNFGATTNEARAAVLLLSTNNLPLLVRYIAYDRSKTVAWQIYRILPMALSDKLPGLEEAGTEMRRREKLASRAVLVFQQLGPKGTGAVAGLTDILENGRCENAFLALHALNFIGEPAMPSIVSVARKPHHRMRYFALRSLWRYTNSPAAFCVLTNALHDPDRSAREQAAEALEGKEPY